MRDLNVGTGTFISISNLKNSIMLNNHPGTERMFE